MTVTYDDDIPTNGNSRVMDGNRSEGGFGVHQYIINEDIKKVTQACQYLKDDGLLFQINFNSKA